jgi:hypothetical protein
VWSEIELVTTMLPILALDHVAHRAPAARKAAPIFGHPVPLLGRAVEQVAADVGVGVGCKKSDWPAWSSIAGNHGGDVRREHVGLHLEGVRPELGADLVEFGLSRLTRAAIIPAARSRRAQAFLMLGREKGDLNMP